MRLPTTIRGRLILVALASTLPLAILSAFAAYLFVDREYAVAQQTVFERVRLLSQAADLFVSDNEGNLNMLAASPGLRMGDLQRFHAHAEEGNKLAGGVAIVLVDRAGQQLVNTLRPFGAELPRRTDLETQERVFATGKPQVSGFLKGALSGQPI